MSVHDGGGHPLRDSRFTRRTALVGAAATSLTLAARAAAAPYTPSHRLDQPSVPTFGLEYKSPRLTPFVDDLTIPPRRRLGGEIVMAEGRHRFHRDLK
ncbi:MAG: hypothetical protein JHC95_11010, partial [Solirubrobacteraceae bacterium]|nr:hypothetical protein [Solirubrobacteraceae bacterium]